MHQPWQSSLLFCGILATLGLSSSAALSAKARIAEQATRVPNLRLAQAEPPAAASPPARAQAQLVMPSAEQIVLLTRTTFMTLNDALRTGNYTVLRDVAAPAFREANPPERLAQVFSKLIQRRIDLAPVAIMVPQMKEGSLDPERGLLQLSGSFPTRPKQIEFVLIYESVGGFWRLFGILVDATDVPVSTGIAAVDSPPLPARNPRSIRY